MPTSTNRRVAKALAGSPRMAAFLAGEITAEDLDEEELVKGKFRGADGTFRGRGSELIPRKFHEACVRELRHRIMEKFQGQSMGAVDTIFDVMENGEGASETIEDGRGGRITTKEGTGRFIAAKYVVERVIGPIPQRTETSSTLTIWQGAIEAGDLIVDVQEEDATIDVDVVEETVVRRRKRGQPSE